jgi:hypothetical protein
VPGQSTPNDSARLVALLEDIKNTQVALATRLGEIEAAVARQGAKIDSKIDQLLGDVVSKSEAAQIAKVAKLEATLETLEKYHVVKTPQ